MNSLPFRRLVPLAVISLLLGPGESRAETEPPDAGRKYVLYMGADLAVQQGKRFYQVEDVDGSEFVITVGGKSRFVRTRLQANHLKVEHELKLAPLSVRLDDMHGEAGYTPAADPRHKFNARTGAAAGAQAASDLANYNATEIANTLAAVRGGASKWVERESQLEAELSKQQDALNMANFQTAGDYGSVGNMANALALELAEGNFDMIDVSFRVSSPEPLDDPYMVVLVEFQPRGAKPGETSLLIHAKALDPIGPDPKYIRIREGGMPVGFKFIRHEVHIYNRGKEVATSESSKRVEISPDEAREYILIEHLAANKTATVPPAPVVGSLPAATRRQVSPDQLNRVCYARVAKDGKFIGLYADESASLRVADDQLTQLFAEALYRPALAEGKPMDGTVRVRLADLVL